MVDTSRISFDGLERVDEGTEVARRTPTLPSPRTRWKYGKPAQPGRGSCRELLAALQVAEAMGYLPALDPVVLDRIDHINVTLYP